MHDVALVGLHGGRWFGPRAEEMLRGADVLIGARRHLDLLPADLAGEQVELTSPVAAVLDLAGACRAGGQRVCVLASGDPGFFGLVRLARDRFPMAVCPAPSSVSLAFAAAGTNWDDAVVVSAHGRPLDEAVAVVTRHPKVAVLTSPDQPPEALGKALVAAGCPGRRVVVGSHLGEPAESVFVGGVEDLAGGTFDPLSVVVVDVELAADGAGLAWGLPEDSYEHRAGMVTKAEVRAVVLGKLSLPPVGVLWDVGAGSGSVAVECARLAPCLSVYAVERSSDDVTRLRTNAQGTAVTVVHGEAPAAFGGLPDPDRAFVGGGGLAVLDAVVERLRPGGTVVASYAALDRAAAAAVRLGNLVQVTVARGVPVGEGDAIRLAAENPVFVCWGPAS
ncbi:MAG: precorrin-6y C5,15-methyltransferase (decarboxylating) subunit CbiE [Acidimicrobiales bacterium]